MVVRCIMMTAGVATDIRTNTRMAHIEYIQIVGIRMGNGLATQSQIKLVKLTISKAWSMAVEYFLEAGFTFHIKLFSILLYPIIETKKIVHQGYISSKINSIFLLIKS